MQEKAAEIMRRLEKEYPGAEIALDYGDTLQLLVATILSAQCTDERVNIVTRELFEKYKTVEDYANADIEEFEQDIRSTGFYRQKAKNLKRACQLMIERHDGKVPKTMQELTELPGIARKTANIILTSGYGIVEGIAVDTHVKRLSKRLGFTKFDNPEKIEKDLIKEFPKDYWPMVNHALITHGRAVCKARTPVCSKCVLSDICPRIGAVKSR